MNLNRVTIAGRLARDPEQKFTPKGTAVASVAIAINRKWKDDAGQMKEDVTFVEVELWGATAEAFCKYHCKGKETFIEGRLKTETWDDKTTGNKRHKTLVVGESWQFVGVRPDAQDGAPVRPQAKAAPKPADPLNGPPEDDDVPF
jgi:single-strand DNA-binding protein